MVSPTSEQDGHPHSDADAVDCAAVGRLHLVLAADPVSPAIARDHVRRWLATHRWSPAQIDELVLAISEAVSNSIEDGYGLTFDRADHLAGQREVVELDAWISDDYDGRHAEFSIADYGGWISPPVSKGSRGHGLSLMQACTEQLRIESQGSGTTILLRSHPVPPLW